MYEDQIRKNLVNAEFMFDLATEAGDYATAQRYDHQIGFWKDELVREICANDPYTTPADVRCFEGW